MTTAQATPTIAELLASKRGEAFKTVTADNLGVSRQTYNAWEGGLYVPGDEWAEVLADHLDIDIRELVWMLYVERARQASAHSPRSVDLGDWFGRPIDFWSQAPSLAA